MSSRRCPRPRDRLLATVADRRRGPTRTPTSNSRRVSRGSRDAARSVCASTTACRSSTRSTRWDKWCSTRSTSSQSITPRDAEPASPADRSHAVRHGEPQRDLRRDRRAARPDQGHARRADHHGVVVIRSERVVLPDGMRPAAIRVDDGRIAAIESPSHGTSGAATPPAPLIDAGAAVVMPGLVDTHVHINEPGRTDWEGFETATRAAAAGGVTTLVDMPLNSIPATTTVAALEAKRRAAQGRCHVDVGFWGGVVPGNAARSRAAGARRRARLQVLSQSIGRRRVRARQRSGSARGDADRRARPACRCWCTPSGRRCCASRIRARTRAATRRGCDSRPPAAEQAAIDLLIELSARHVGARAHRPPGVGRRAAHRSDGARARGRADHRRNLPALPDVLRRRHRRRRHGAQMRAADSRARASRAAVARARRRAHRPRRHRSLAGAAGAEAPRGRRLPRRVGRHRLAAVRRCRSSGPAPPRAASRSSGSPSGCAPRRRGSPGSTAARARSRPGYDADLVICRSRSRVDRRRVAPLSSPCGHAV